MGDAMRTRLRNEFCAQTLDGLQEQYTVSRRVYAVRKDFPASFAVILMETKYTILYAKRI